MVLSCCRIIPSVGEKPIARPSEDWQYTSPSDLCLFPQATKDRTADGQALTEARKQLKEETQLRLVSTGGARGSPHRAAKGRCHAELLLGTYLGRKMPDPKVLRK